MVFIGIDKNGAALPAGFADVFWRQDAKPNVSVSIDFPGTGAFVGIPHEDIVSFSFSDKAEGTNGRACSNTISLELNNFDHRYSSHVPNASYNPNIHAYNGPILADGRGNIRPGRAIQVIVSLDEYPGVEVELFVGRIGQKGFREEVGAGNTNKVSIEAADYAKLLIDKEAKGTRVFFGGQWVEQTIYFEGCYICAPSDTAHSLVHKIVALGDPDGLINIIGQEILIPIQYAPIDGSCWSEIADLAEAVHGVASFSGHTLYFGSSRLYIMDPNSATFTNDHFNSINHGDNTESIKNNLSLEMSGYEKLGMCALWMYPNSNEYGYIKDGGAFLDLSDPEDMPELYDDNVIYKCKYSVNPNTPSVASGGAPTLTSTSGVPITQREAEKYEVVGAKNISYIFVHNGTGVLDRFNITALRDTAILHMDKGTLTQDWIRRLVIYGEPITYKEAIKSLISNAASEALYGKKYADFENKYVTKNQISVWDGATTVLKAFDLAWLEIAARRLSAPRKTYEFECNMPLLLARSGSIVRLTESRQGSGVNVDMRIDSTSFKYDARKATWNVAFKASEEAIYNLSFAFTSESSGGVSPSVQASRTLDYNTMYPHLMVPYQVGDQLIAADNTVYVAITPRTWNEDFSWADWTQIVASNQGQVNAIEAAAKILVISTGSILRNRLGELSPQDLVVYGYNQNMNAYAGRFVIAISHNGVDYVDDYIGDIDEASHTYHVPVAMVVGLDTLFVAAIKISMYASGGLVTMIAQKNCAVSADPSTAAIYWGSLLSAPSGELIAGDYYFDKNTVALGGGFLQYYTGSGWITYTSSMSGYANAMNTAMPDIQPWVVDNPTGGDSGLIVAANGVFGSIAASSAFIGSLAAQEVSILGTLKTGAGAEENCRVGIKDQTGIQSKGFTGDGNNDLAVVEDGVVAGTIIATITDAQTGDIGPSGGKIFPTNLEAANSDLEVSGWDNAVAAAAASTLGGMTDWVLPTRTQLTSLRTAFGSTEALRAAMGLSEMLYWTSEESGADAYVIDMETGAESLKEKARNQFSATITMPHSMYRMTMAHVNGKLYFPRSGGTYLEIFDIANGTFTTITMPNPILRNAMEHVDGKLYFPQHNGDLLEIFDIASGTFDTTLIIPHSAYRWTMAHVNGKLYLPQYGGTSLEIFDIASGLFDATVTMPSSADYYTMAHVDGKLYFPQSNDNRLEIFDIASGLFNATVTMPHSMYRWAMVHVNGKLYFPQSQGYSLEIFDIASGTFTTITMPHSMYRSIMVHVNGRLYFPENGGTLLEIFDIANGTFTTITMPHSMDRRTAAYVNERLYFPQSQGYSLEIFLPPYCSRAIRSNTETRRWQHTADTGSGPGAPVAHGVIAAYAQVAIDLDITVAFQGVANHITGDYWTIIQGSMYGLSIKDGTGDEYVKASNGVLYAKNSGSITLSNGLVPTVGAGIVSNDGTDLTFGDGTVIQKALGRKSNPEFVKLRVDKFNSNGSEYDDWPNTAVAIRTHDEFHQRNMLMFGLRDDSPYITGTHAWHFQIRDADSVSRTASVVGKTNLYLRGPAEFFVNDVDTKGMGVHSSGLDWVRFYNGTQICWGVTGQISISSGGGSAYYGSAAVSFPVAFTTNYVLAVSAPDNYTTGIVWGGYAPMGSSGAQLYAIGPNNGMSARISYVATGRWTW